MKHKLRIPFGGNINVSVKLIYEGKVQSSSLAYNRRESEDRRPLGRDPERSRFHLHIRVNIFSLSSWPHRVRPGKLFTSVAVTPPPVLVPTLKTACPEFHVGCRLGRDFFILSVCYRRCP